MRKSFKRTRLACYVGTFVQAVICNLTAILFIPLMELYHLNYVDLGILVAINFTAQVAVDILFSGMMDRYGYRKFTLPAILFALVGLLLFAAAPILFDNVFIGMVIATIVFAAASGLLEILISPIVNALPSEDKGASMSLMHSFYAWGQVGVIILTTLALYLFGAQNWQWIVLAWAIVPFTCFILFFFSPFPDTIPEEHRVGMKSLLLKPFFIFAMLAIFCGAATEVGMNQWSSTFMEKGLAVPKVIGDLLGMCGFAFMLGLGRMLHGIYGAKLNIHRVLIFCSALSLVCYLAVALSPYNALNIFACALCGFGASLLWPGTLVVSAERYPMAGAWLFAILAAAGDIGAAVGPYLTGFVVDHSIASELISKIATIFATTPEQAAIRLGFLAAAIFPAITLVCHIVLKKMKAKENREQ